MFSSRTDQVRQFLEKRYDMTGMDNPTIGQVVLITGGGSGIGAATCEALSSLGWTVVICGRRRELLDQVAQATGAHPAVIDITDPDAVRGLVEDTVERFGRLDAVVLNAGIVRPGPISEVSEQDWASVVDTNLTAPYRVLHHALPHLIRSRGSVVGVSSVSALRASAGTAGYNATKAGLTMLVQSVGVDYGPQGVRANVVCPGWTRTEMADAEMAEYAEAREIDSEEAYRIATGSVPLQRPAHASEVAATIAWLVSPAASYVNAAVIPIDGGLQAVDPGTAAFADTPQS
jgi:meso-butanediol dehydrogenase/(S,S)-butanediol dehydrogenase/diacetyl reductase